MTSQSHFELDVDRLAAALRARTSGPGGLYNIGNAAGLLTGLVAYWLAAREAGGLNVVLGYLAGSPSAVALTLAMLVFFWSGEMYHRAWAAGRPDARLVWLGDIGSGIGALLLGLGLLILNEPLLAATAGALHAAGKFGSAFAGGRKLPLWPRHWPDGWRTLVVLSRVPALLAATLQIARDLGGQAPLHAFEPAALILCYLLWLRADILLIK